MVAVPPRMDHEPVGEGGVLAGGAPKGGTQLLLAEGDRVIRNHGVSGRAAWSGGGIRARKGKGPRRGLHGPCQARSGGNRGRRRLPLMPSATPLAIRQGF